MDLAIEILVAFFLWMAFILLLWWVGDRFGMLWFGVIALLAPLLVGLAECVFDDALAWF